MSNTSFPDSAVVYILDDIPGVGEFQGTGAIIGPHTVLTAAHLVYDADTGAKADAISLYPGFTPDTTTYNPTGALGGFQSIHTIKVPDGGDELSAQGSQSDFAVIDTSADLSAYGSFALDPGFTSGDVVVKGYPASNDGNLAGTGGVVGRDGRLSDIGTAALPLSPGYSGGPLYDTVERNGSVVDAVVGTVSTNEDAMKLTKAKVDLIRHWVASDRSLYGGGQDAPKGLVPEIAGTASGAVDAAAVPSSPQAAAGSAAAPGVVDTDAAARAGGHGGNGHHGADHAVPTSFSDFVSALRMPDGGDVATGPAAVSEAVSFAPPDHRHGGHGRVTDGA